MEHFGSKRGWNAYLSNDNVVFYMVKRSQGFSSCFTTRQDALENIMRYIETGWIN